MTAEQSDARTPSERLALSRERLRQALSGASSASGAASSPGQPAAWWKGLAALPGAAIAIDAVQQWWARHPLRATTQIAFSAARGVVQPIAQRHPWALVLGAGLIGGLLAWRRPWGWVLKPALFAGLAQQLLISSLKAQAQAQRSSADRAV
jgi:hypothetical protein